MRVYTNRTRRASVLRLFALCLALPLAGAKGCDNPNEQGVTDRGYVTGRLVDAASPTTPISTATVQIGTLVYRLVGSDRGGFTIQNVPTGTQHVHIDAIGYIAADVDVIVHKDKPADIGGGQPYALKPAGP